MNRRIIAIVTALSMLCLLPLSLHAAENRRDGAAREDAAPISETQKTEVKKILSGYDKSALTAEQAKAIHRAFKEAGIRGGPSLNEAVKDAGFDPKKLRDLDPPPDRQNKGDGGRQIESRREKDEVGDGIGDKRGKGGGGYSIEQAISDRAQLTTIAFNGLAFMTGDFCADTFIPPGKVSDYFGFQYMRDVDRGELGHNTSFLPRIANNMLKVLTESQRKELIALAKEQAPSIRELAVKRYPLIMAYRRLLEGKGPSTALDLVAVKKTTADLFELDGKLALRRAEILGGIVKTFSSSQKNSLARLKFGDSTTWPDVPDQVDKRSMSHDEHVAVMTYASEMFSWYAGSAEGDAYFCPERHGTYFGGFYMKDRPAMGNPGYSISTSITGNSGEEMLNILTDVQRSEVASLPDRQRKSLSEIVDVRRKISTELRKFMTGSANTDIVVELSRRYGELDGELAYLYATAFAKVYSTLDQNQKGKLKTLRNLDGYQCKGAYLYSESIRDFTVIDTDFLFKK